MGLESILSEPYAGVSNERGALLMEDLLAYSPGLLIIAEMDRPIETVALGRALEYILKETRTLGAISDRLRHRVE